MKIRDTYKTDLTIFAYSGLLLLVLASAGCQSMAKTDISNQPINHSHSDTDSDFDKKTLEQQALRIQRTLANKDFARLTNDIHPARGIRFSMYAYIRPKTDKVFSREQYAKYVQSPNIRFTWGEKDGTGDLFITSLPTYLDTWVDGKKFNNTSINVNKFQNNGNSINNLQEIYPESEVAEFYYKGTDEYDGMDWRILRLVFDEYQGKRYLIAIINDEWTT